MLGALLKFSRFKKKIVIYGAWVILDSLSRLHLAIVPCGSESVACSASSARMA